MAISSHSSRTPRLGRPAARFRDNIVTPQTNIEQFDGGGFDEIESMVPYRPETAPPKITDKCCAKSSTHTASLRQE